MLAENNHPTSKFSLNVTRVTAALRFCMHGFGFPHVPAREALLCLLQEKFVHHRDLTSPLLTQTFAFSYLQTRSCVSYSVIIIITPAGVNRAWCSFLVSENSRLKQRCWRQTACKEMTGLCALQEGNKWHPRSFFCLCVIQSHHTLLTATG